MKMHVWFKNEVKKTNL